MNHKTKAFRRFYSNDIPEILRIQEANLASNLSESEMLNGFLSVEFLPQQFEEMNREIPCVVADLGSKLGGYLFGSSLSYNSRFPILAHMISLFSETPLRNRMLDQYRSFIYGPICIDRSLRGGGVIEGLFAEFLHRLAGSFDIGVLFISQDNHRSLRAHISNLEMEKIRDFKFKGKSFCLLAFDVPAHA
ncbi:hypothetical protein ACFL0H_02785 [Thermodesulfobacteriota bacterium]